MADTALPDWARSDGGGAAPAAGWNLDQDALAHALSWLVGHHGRPRSPESLLAGLPVHQRLTPDQALRVLADAGFNGGLLQRRVADLHELLLPAVLLLRGDDACIVVARRGNGQYDIVMPGPEPVRCTAGESELEAEYTGTALVATPQVETARPSLWHAPGAHWFWGTMRRYLPYYRGAMLSALLTNVLMLVIGLVTRVVYDKVIPHHAYVTLWTLAVGGVLALAFDLMARQLRAHLIDTAGRKADLIIGSLLFRQTLGLRMEHRPASAGAYAHTLSQMEMVREFFASVTLSALSDLPFIVVFVAMVFVAGGPLGWVLVLAIPVLMVLSAVVQAALRRATSQHLHQHAELHGVLVESVDGMEDIKAAGAQGRFLRRFEESTALAAAATLRARHIGAWTSNFSSLAQQIVTLVMLVWGVYLIDDKVITGGALIGAVMYAQRALAPLGSLTSLATRYQGARAAMKALDQMMALPVDREPGRAYVPRPQIEGRLALHEVGFSYPQPVPHGAAPSRAAEGPRVLKGLNLQIAPGERIAILGRIGSGKSTVLRLLAGLYQPTEGRVEVDGLDLRQIDPADFRARIGFVGQDPRLFNGSLRDNVLLDRPAADATRLAEVAQLTGLDRLVASHPMGWDLPVGESGSQLSGGQRQLVALARCLVMKPRVVLMDEPTSSMDAQSEVLFLRQLKAACGDCTLVLVTHRPAVLELVQRVLVIDGGRVVMDGPKAAVLAALSGQRPATPPQAAPGTPQNLHLHPTARPLPREASV